MALRALLNGMIHFLGGFTQDSFYEQLEERTKTISGGMHLDEVLYLRSQLESERARCEKLQEMIFRKFGILVADIPQQQRKSVEPIQTAQLPWPERKRRYEQLDREVARQQDKQTPESKRTEEHWRAQGAVPVSPGIDKDLETLGEENVS